MDLGETRKKMLDEAKALSNKYLLAGVDEEYCGVLENDAFSFVCTRGKGHEGKHAAHGTIGQVCAVWEEVSDAKEEG